jgi:MoxR-like ATPase
MQNILWKIYVSDNIYDYVSSIIDATRHPEKYNLKEIKKYIQYGISPRWGISLIDGAKVLAGINGRDFVLPEDIKQLTEKTLAHRLVLTYEALADNISEKEIINKIVNKIAVV